MTIMKTTLSLFERAKLDTGNGPGPMHWNDGTDTNACRMGGADWIRRNGLLAADAVDVTCPTCLVYIAEIDLKTARADVHALAKFKSYVHTRLDNAGVPANPQPPNHALHGCRVGDRLDVLITSRLALISERDTLANDAENARIEIERKEAVIVTVTAERDTAREEIVKLAARLTLVGQDLDATREECASLSKQVNRLTNELDNEDGARATIAKLTAERDAWQIESNKQSRRVDELSAQAAELTRQRNEFDAAAKAADADFERERGLVDLFARVLAAQVAR